MAKSGYVIFVVEAHPRMKPRDVRVLSNVDGRGGDLLRAAASAAMMKKGRLIKQSRWQSACRFDTAKGRSRYLWLGAKSGPYGSNGFLMDVNEEEDDAQFSARQARAIELRAMLIVPTEGTTGLLFVERKSATHLRREVEDYILKSAGRLLGVNVRVVAHVDKKAWEDFLDRGAAAEVTEVWRSTRTEDLGANRGGTAALKMTLTGNAALRRGRALISGVRRQLDGTTSLPSHVHMAEVEVADDFEFERTTVRVSDGFEERTVEVADGELPQWVYTIDGGLSDTTLRNVWAQHAKNLLGTYGVTLEDDWHKRPVWPDGFLLDGVGDE